MKNNLIFLITFLLILISISYGISKTNTQKVSKTNKENQTTLENYSFYKNENKERYNIYQKKNPNLTQKQIIINVNIGLDNPYYTNITETKEFNKSTILVNKYISLPANYVPDNLTEIDEKYANKGMKLVKEAKNAFEALSHDAALNNLTIKAMSTYRSYNYQKNLYTNYTKIDGEEKANTYSAKPGHSEHQTGLAVDVYNESVPYTDFEKTAEYKWMQENAYKYGFILRYPKTKENITGYSYESWHYRYVGFEFAEYILKNDLTFDEYYMEFLDK